jgi:hypothetical protein
MSKRVRAGRPRGRSSSPGGVKNFYFSVSSRLALGFTQPPIQGVARPLSLVVKRPGREGDHSPRTSTEVKKTWVYTSTPHTPSWLIPFLVKYRDNFTFTLYSESNEMLLNFDLHQTQSLCYKPEGSGFDSRWGHCFTIYVIFPAALWPRGRLSL